MYRFPKEKPTQYSVSDKGKSSIFKGHMMKWHTEVIHSFFWNSTASTFVFCDLQVFRSLKWLTLICRSSEINEIQNQCDTMISKWIGSHPAMQKDPKISLFNFYYVIQISDCFLFLAVFLTLFSKKPLKRNITNSSFRLWCWRRLLKSPLDCKEIKAVNSKGNQSWILIRRTDAEAPILWPHDAKNWLTGKDPDAGTDRRQEEKGTTKDEMVGWQHRLDGHELEQAWRDGDGQGSLACCSPWGRKVLDITEQLNWAENTSGTFKISFCTSSSLPKSVLT